MTEHIWRRPGLGARDAPFATQSLAGLNIMSYALYPHGVSSFLAWDIGTDRKYLVSNRSWHQRLRPCAACEARGVYVCLVQRAESPEAKDPEGLGEEGN